MSPADRPPAHFHRRHSLFENTPQCGVHIGPSDGLTAFVSGLSKAPLADRTVTGILHCHRGPHRRPVAINNN